MDTLYKKENILPNKDDPASEEYIFSRIVDDRKEVMDLLEAMKGESRVAFFLNEYDLIFEQLFNAKNMKLQMRKKVRELKANMGVSSIKSIVVQDIYKQTDDHIAELRREVNVAYHQLIEVQEAEDAKKVSIADIIKEMRYLRECINERMNNMPQRQIRQQERLEEQYEKLKVERERLAQETHTLREEIVESNAKQITLEKDFLRLQDEEAELALEAVRADSEIVKATQKRIKIEAALEAAKQQVDVREKDMDDVRKKLEEMQADCKRSESEKHVLQVRIEKIHESVAAIATKIRSKNNEYEQRMKLIYDLDAEVCQKHSEYNKKMQESKALASMDVLLDMVKKSIRQKFREVNSKKAKIILLKDFEKSVNLELLAKVEATKRNFKINIKQQTDLLKQRDLLRRRFLNVQTIMRKDQMLCWLHRLANNRLKQDNTRLVLQGKDQRNIIEKLKMERDLYVKQAMTMTRKALTTSESERKATETIFTVMKRMASEDIKVLEMQNLYECVRTEQVIYSRNILQLHHLISKLKSKCRSMLYEAQKLLQEREYREKCLIQGAQILQKFDREIFVLKVNLRDLKESNAQTKMVIENQTLEEKKLVKLTRVMNMEKMRESKGLELVIRDVEALNLTLIKRHHELHDLFRTVKLKQSLLGKEENVYNMCLKQHKEVTTNLKQTKALRKLDQKKRNIVDRLVSYVKLLHVRLENTQLRSKGLMEEMKHPRNIHRWRGLQSRDPEAYNFVRTLHILRHQIQNKVTTAAATTAKIHLLDREYISLTTHLLMNPSPETVLQLKLYKDDLETRYLQIKALTEELKTALTDKRDALARREILQKKMKKIQDIWLQPLSKDHKKDFEKNIRSSRLLSLSPKQIGFLQKINKTLKLHLSPRLFSAESSSGDSSSAYSD